METMDSFKDIDYRKSTKEVLKQVKWLYKNTDIETRQQKYETWYFPHSANIKHNHWIITYTYDFNNSGGIIEFCIIYNHIEVIKYLIKKKNINKQYKQGESLLWCIDYNRPKIANYLLDNGVMPNYVYNYTLGMFIDRRLRQITNLNWCIFLVKILKDVKINRWLHEYIRLYNKNKHHYGNINDICTKGNRYTKLKSVLKNTYQLDVLNFIEYFSMLQKLCKKVKYLDIYSDLFFSI